MAWYEYQPEARQLPTMYDLSGPVAKDVRKAFWLVLGTLGFFVIFPVAVLGAFGIISFGPGLVTITILLMIGVWAAGRDSNKKSYESNQLHPYPPPSRAKPWAQRNGIIQRRLRRSEE